MHSVRPAPMFFEREEPEWTAWDVVFDTSKTGEVPMASIPFWLYLQPDALIRVEWGDGEETVLDSSKYTHLSSLASVHQYACHGRYNARMLSKEWTKVRMCVCSGMVIGEGRYNDKSACLRWWRKALAECGAMPLMAGTIHFHQCSPSSVPSGLFEDSWCLDSAFEECRNLRRVSESLFSEWKDARSFRRTFWNCASLDSVPAGLFKSVPADADRSWCFYGCPAGGSE